MSSDRLKPRTGRARFGLPDFGSAGICDRYEIFISSSDECRPARTLCREIIQAVINPPLSREPGIPMLEPVMWEDALPQRIEEDESVNDFFVRVALECHATIVLLESTLGAGTREEVLALLGRPVAERKPLAIVAFAPRSGQARTTELASFLGQIGRASNVLYASTGPMDSQEAVMTLAKVTCGFALSAASRSRTQLIENDAI